MAKRFGVASRRKLLKWKTVTQCVSEVVDCNGAIHFASQAEVVDVTESVNELDCEVNEKCALLFTMLS